MLYKKLGFDLIAESAFVFLIAFLLHLLIWRPLVLGGGSFWFLQIHILSLGSLQTDGSLWYPVKRCWAVVLTFPSLRGLDVLVWMENKSSCGAKSDAHKMTFSGPLSLNSMNEVVQLQHKSHFKKHPLEFQMLLALYIMQKAALKSHPPTPGNPTESLLRL